jgi:UDP-N-acetylmuramyl pentapeptide phosphotransferase/UDP-N-acetylglucosamine-1-phosphate transferase
LPFSLLFLTGVIDDLQNIDFKIKLLLQIIAAKLIIDQGFVLDEFYGFNGLVELNYFIAQLLSGFLFISIINAINFIDGIDGLAISFTLFILISIGVLSSNNNLIPLNLILIFALIIALFFNYKKYNKVFLGDSGSLLLGGVIAINLLQLLNPEVKINFGLDPNKFLLSALLIFYPLIDLTRTVVFRIKAKKSPFQADKTHLHHLLLRITDSHLKSVMVLMSGCIGFLALGIGLWVVFDEIGIILLIVFTGLAMLFMPSARK